MGLDLHEYQECEDTRCSRCRLRSEVRKINKKKLRDDKGHFVDEKPWRPGDANFSRRDR